MTHDWPAPPCTPPPTHPPLPGPTASKGFGNPAKALVVLSGAHNIGQDRAVNASSCNLRGEVMGGRVLTCPVKHNCRKKM